MWSSKPRHPASTSPKVASKSPVYQGSATSLPQSPLCLRVPRRASLARSLAPPLPNKASGFAGVPMGRSDQSRSRDTPKEHSLDAFSGLSWTATVRTRDFHPLDFARAGRTHKTPPILSNQGASYKHVLRRAHFPAMGKPLSGKHAGAACRAALRFQITGTLSGG